MNYYKRHIGDYARKTRHLSLLEHGVYTVLLDTYYDRERQLSETEAIRFTNARTDEELRAVKTVLSEFFHEENGLFSQSHADEELQSFHKRQKINRKLGAIGGKRNAKRIGSETLSETEANDKPPISHKPLEEQDQKISTSNDVEGKTGVLPCPVVEIVNLYHELLPELPACRKITPGRRSSIQQRWREDLTDLDDWRFFFSNNVKTSDFLMGRTQPMNGRPVFRADIGWLVNPTNFAKIIEGKYSGKVRR